MRCNGIHISKTAYHKDTAKIASDGRRQTTRVRTRSQCQLIIGNHFVPQVHGLTHPVNRGYGCTKTQGNAVIGVKTFGAQKQSLQFHLTQQIGLGERRALVGEVFFGTNQGDVTVKSIFA